MGGITAGGICAVCEAARGRTDVAQAGLGRRAKEGDRRRDAGKNCRDAGAINQPRRSD